VIDNLFFHVWFGPIEQEQIVTFLSRNLSGSPRVNAGQTNVIDNYLRIVFLAPFFDISFIKPLVISRDEMNLLENLEGFLPGGAIAGKY
jgi:hypothetical protein